MSARNAFAAFARIVLLFALLMLGCNSAPNPCPSGMRPRYDLNRCVDPLDTDVRPITDGRSGVSFPARDGAPIDIDARLENSPDTGSGPEMDASDITPDATFATDASMAVADTGMADAAKQGICTKADLDAWSAFHTTPGLVASLTTCVAEGCTASECPAVQCTMKEAHMVACEPCVQAEAQCILGRCGAACGEPGSDPECRACACEIDCVAAFESCAETSLALCSGVYGRDSTPEERVLAAPFMFRQKSGTGLLQSAPVVSSPSDPKFAWGFLHHHAVGWTKMLSWSQGTNDYLLQSMSACAAPPCRVRISPVLSDGSVGRPVYEARQPRGFDELEQFAIGGRVFIAMYAPTLMAGSEPGLLRIVEVVEGSGSIELTIRLEQPFRAASAPWSAVEAFAGPDAVYLAFYDALTGGAVIHEAQFASDAITLSERARMQWESGLTIIETFPHAQVPYLLTYRRDTGQTRIAPFAFAAGTIEVGTTSHEGVWMAGFDRVISYQLDGATNLFRQSQNTRTVEVLRLSASASEWGSALGVVTYADIWGRSPVYDLVAVAHHGNW